MPKFEGKSENFRDGLFFKFRRNGLGNVGTIDDGNTIKKRSS